MEGWAPPNSSMAMLSTGVLCGGGGVCVCVWVKIPFFLHGASASTSSSAPPPLRLARRVRGLMGRLAGEL